MLKLSLLLLKQPTSKTMNLNTFEPITKIMMNLNTFEYIWTIYIVTTAQWYRKNTIWDSLNLWEIFT